MRTSNFVVVAFILLGLLLALIYRSAPPAVVPAIAPPPVSALLAVSTPKAGGAKALTFCSDSWPPYSDQAGTAREGYVVELLRAIYEPLGYTVNYTVQPWSRCLVGVRSGLYSGLAGAEHDDIPDLFFPRLMAGASFPTFFTSKTHLWTYSGEMSLRQIRLGVVQNYTYAPALDRYIAAEAQGDRIVVFRGDEPFRQMLAGLEGGRVDAIIENSLVVEAFLRQQRLPAELLRTAGSAGPGRGVFVPFSPVDERSPELAALFDRRLLELRRDGVLQRILDRYQVSDWREKVSGRGY